MSAWWAQLDLGNVIFQSIFGVFFSGIAMHLLFSPPLLFIIRIMPNFPQSATDLYKTHDPVYKPVKLSWSSGLYFRVDTYPLPNKRSSVGFSTTPGKVYLRYWTLHGTVSDHSLMLWLICLRAVLSITWSLLLCHLFLFLLSPTSIFWGH